jgi:hypothetical protein
MASRSSHRRRQDDLKALGARKHTLIIGIEGKHRRIPNKITIGWMALYRGDGLLAQCDAWAALRLRVAAAFLAAADRLAAGRAAEAAPPLRPPLCAAGWPVDLPRPDPPARFPPPSSLLTVAQARRSASFSGTPRLS